MYIVAIFALGLLLLVYYNYLLLVFSPSKSAPFRWDQLKVLLKIQEFSLTFSAAKDFSMCFLLLLCCTYLFTALSNWKHQKLSEAENLWMSSGKCVKLWRLITHALTSYCSSHKMQAFLHSSHFYLNWRQTQPFLEQVPTISILPQGAIRSRQTLMLEKPVSGIPPLQEKVAVRVYSVNRMTYSQCKDTSVTYDWVSWLTCFCSWLMVVQNFNSRNTGISLNYKSPHREWKFCKQCTAVDSYNIIITVYIIEFSEATYFFHVL